MLPEEQIRTTRGLNISILRWSLCGALTVRPQLPATCHPCSYGEKMWTPTCVYDFEPKHFHPCFSQWVIPKTNSLVWLSSLPQKLVKRVCKGNNYLNSHKLHFIFIITFALPKLRSEAEEAFLFLFDTGGNAMQILSGRNEI